MKSQFSEINSKKIVATPNGDPSAIILDIQGMAGNSAGNNTNARIDFNNFQVLDNENLPAVDFVQRLLIEGSVSSYTTVDWQNCSLSTNNGVLSVDWQNNALVDSTTSNVYSVNWVSRVLNSKELGFFSFGSLDWQHRQLVYADTVGFNNYVTMDWHSGLFISPFDHNITMDFYHRQLSGNWSGTSFAISGSPVITAAQTGGFVTTGQTGLFALDSKVVHNTGDETISGLKSFSGIKLSNLYPGSTNYSTTGTSIINSSIVYDGVSNYYANNSTYIFEIYPYINMHGVKVFANSGSQISLTDNGTSGNFYMTGHWNTVSGADGYRIVVTQDLAYGATGDYYIDTTFTSFAIGIIDSGADSVSNLYYAYANGPVPISPSGQYIFTGTSVNGDLRMNGSLMNDTGDLNLLSTQNLNLKGQTVFSSGDSFRLDSHGNILFYHTLEENSWYNNDRLTQFANVIDPVGYTGNLFDAAHNYAGGIPVWRVNGGSNYIGGADNRGYVEVAMSYGLNGTKGTIAEFLPRRDTSYSAPGQNGVFMHPLKLDGYGHIYMGNNPESEHTIWFPAPHWVTIRPSTPDCSQFFLMGGSLTTGTFNGAIQSDGTSIYTTQSGITSKIATFFDLSGYVNTGSTGSFITSGQTGVFATTSNLNSTGSSLATWTGASTGLYYPRNTNPSGYVTTGQTGSFITSGQTGVFATTGNLTATGSSLAAWTGASTGLYYPLNNNISGYVTTGQTGAFATSGNLAATGSSLATWTGASTGLYYPRGTNPSGYLTTGQTGAFYSTSNPSGYLTSGGFADITDATGTHRIGILQTNPQFTMDINGSVGNSAGNIPSAFIDLSNTYLRDGSNVISLIWHGRTLRDTSQNVSLDWGNRMLSGSWSGQSFNISGSPVVIASQTGAFASLTNLASTGSTLSNWTGTSTGLFYPLANNPSGYATTGYVQNSIAGGQIYYFQSGSDATTPNYFQLIDSSPTLSSNASVSASVTSGGGSALLTGFVTPSGGFIMQEIPAGLWLFNLYGSTSSLTNGSYLVNSIYSLGVTGLETLLFSVTGTALGSSTQLNSSYYSSTGMILNSGDRLISKVYALTNNVLATTVTFNYQSASSPSHISTPLDFGYSYYSNQFVSKSQTGIFAVDSAVVHKTGSETITGAKFFNNISFNNMTGSQVYNSTGAHVVNLDGDTYADLNNTLSVNMDNRSLYDQFGVETLAWKNHLIYDTGHVVSIDWQNRVLSGNWNSQGFSISGNPVVTGGPYYPLNSNPSGYITTGQTGAFGGGGGVTTGAINPAWSNLTWGTTTTWNVTTGVIEDRKILVMTGNSTLSISGLFNGWCGALQTLQSGAAASGYSLALPSGTKVAWGGSGIVNLTSGSGAYDFIGFMYNGTTLFANISNKWT